LRVTKPGQKNEELMPFRRFLGLCSFIPFLPPEKYRCGITIL
jgi:hypothetical protein